ncbi:MAG: right-handed parallel beta-helix repeat-containing protein, partial [Candidatus Thorarchaeota archaeon SMTZ1-45]
MYRKTRLRKIAVVFQFSFVFVIILLSSFQDNGQMMPFQNQSIEETEEPKFDFTKRIDVASDVSGVVFIDGTNPSQDWDDSPYVTGSGTFNDPFIIEDLVFTDCGGKSGIVIQNTTSYFKIENCSISRTGTESEWGGHSSDWEYIGNRAGIQLLNVGNGTIVGNVFDDVANGFLLRNCKNITLEDNHVETSANQGIAAVDCSNITLTSNTARSWSCGAMVINCDNSSYIDNQLLSFAHDGLHMIDSDFNLFFANNISYCHWFGIDATNSKNNLFIRNLLTNNGYPGYSGRGIHGENIENSTIIGNDCTMNTDAGIYIYDSDNCIIEGNNCSATKDPEELVGNYGIYTSGSFYLSLINNTCYAPSGTGMRLDSAYHSIVRNNT